MAWDGDWTNNGHGERIDWPMGMWGVTCERS
jgi:hypothetical protein